MRPAFKAGAAVALLSLLAACVPAQSGTQAPGNGSSGVATADGSSTVTPSTTIPSVLAVGASAWVSVSVARLWDSPSAPWPVDAPALRSPVRFRQWLRAMTLDQRRALDVRSQSEALLGDRVVVLALRPRWAKVAVPSQPTPQDRRGYPGWVPVRQLTARAPTPTTQVATVTSRTAWLRSDDAADARTAEISFGTTLHVVGQLGHEVRVLTPRGVTRRLRDDTVVVHAPGQPALTATRADLERTARSFLGLAYLWGGLSGFGLDCSGLTWLDYRVHGIRIPRDAQPQSQHGRRTTTRGVGDLLFYARAGLVHHVSMYVGGGYMIHSPGTGEHVQVIAFSAQPLRGEYVGARRYLP